MAILKEIPMFVKLTPNTQVSRNLRNFHITVKQGEKVILVNNNDGSKAEAIVLEPDNNNVIFIIRS